MFNGFTEVSMTIAKLPVFYKQRDHLFYTSWAYALPSWRLRIPTSFAEGIVGSPFYIALEVLARGYNQAADVWSAGVILYILLSGMPPFWGKTKLRIFDSIRAANFQFPSDQISASAKDLITGMLCTDPTQRLTASKVL
ncbi:hypothetical protein IFM89_029581, partial [Coptis chinensis]